MPRANPTLYSACERAKRAKRATRVKRACNWIKRTGLLRCVY